MPHKRERHPKEPEIEEVTPSTVQTVGNDTMRVVGSNLQNVVSIQINNFYLAQFQRLNYFTLNFVMPSVEPGTVHLRFVSSNNRVTSYSILAVTKDASTPVITEIVPPLDVIAEPLADVSFYPRREVHLRGSNFTGAQKVQIDGVAMEFNVINDTTIRAIRPAQKRTSSSKPVKFAARDNLIPLPPAPTSQDDVQGTAGKVIGGVLDAIIGPTSIDAVKDVGNFFASIFIHGFQFRVDSSLPFEWLFIQTEKEAAAAFAKPMTATVRTFPAQTVSHCKT